MQRGCFRIRTLDQPVLNISKKMSSLDFKNISTSQLILPYFMRSSPKYPSFKRGFNSNNFLFLISNSNKGYFREITYFLIEIGSIKCC